MVVKPRRPLGSCGHIDFALLLYLLLSQMTQYHFHHFKALCYCAICYDTNLHKTVRQAEVDTGWKKAYLFVTWCCFCQQCWQMLSLLENQIKLHFFCCNFRNKRGCGDRDREESKQRHHIVGSPSSYNQSNNTAKAIVTYDTVWNNKKLQDRLVPSLLLGFHWEFHGAGEGAPCIWNLICASQQLWIKRIPFSGIQFSVEW